MSGVLSVRDAAPEDAAEVAGVHVHSWQVAYRGLVSDAHLDSLCAEDRAACYTFGDTRPSRPRTVVAVTDEAICGFATWGPARDSDASGAGEIYAIYVDPPVWGQGVGQALMREVRTRLHREGYGAALLWVLEGNAQALRFYRSDGWRFDGHRRDERIGDMSVTEVRYRLRLN